MDWPALVVGHSWGTLVASALAQNHPLTVRALVLLSGYYFPKARLDVVAVKPLAFPILGDALRYTLAPITGLAVMPLMLRAMFGPAKIPQRFRREFPLSLTLRPWQIRASAQEGAMMNDAANELQRGYRQMRMHTEILAGDSDRIVSPRHHSEVLANLLPNCTYGTIRSVGHMVHHSAVDRVVQSIKDAAETSQQRDLVD